MLRTITRFYERYRLVMWLTGSAGSLGVPLAGWGVYSLHQWVERANLSVDNPEFMSDYATRNLFSWFFSAGGVLSKMLGALFLLGVIASLILLAVQLLSFLASRTEISGIDETLDDQSSASDEYDPDSLDDYGDMD